MTLPHVEPYVARNYRGLWNPVPDFFIKREVKYRIALLRLVRGYKFYNHIPAMLVQKMIPAGIRDSYFKFCVERNSWDKAICHYYWRKHGSDQNLTFEQYLQEGKFCFNYPLYTDHNGKVLVDRVVKYEFLANEMGEVFTVLGIPFNGDFGARVKSVIRKDNKSYREVYTNEQKEIKLSKRISAGRSDCMVLGGRYFAGKKRLLGRGNVQDAKESCSYKKMTFLIGNQDCSVMKKTLSLKESGK